MSEIRSQKSEVKIRVDKRLASLTSDSNEYLRITMQIKSARDLIVYKRAYELAMEIFHASKHFPAEERYSLTDHYAVHRGRCVQTYGRPGPNADMKFTSLAN
jgi:23S rRNA-intervening sequence protein